MLGKKDQDMTIRYFLWSVFYINVFLLLVAVLVNSNLLFVLCLLTSLSVIMLWSKQQEYIRYSNSSSQNLSLEKVSFFNYLKNNIINKTKHGANGGSIILKDSIGFSVNTTLSKKEYLMHSKLPSIFNPKDFTVSIGSTQCDQPYHSYIFNFDIPSSIQLSKETYGGISSAFNIHMFTCSVNEHSVVNNEGINYILKIPVNVEVNQLYSNKRDESFKMLYSKSSVRGLELFVDMPNHSCYSLPEFLSRNNNAYFHSIPGLLNFVQKLRLVVGGKPIGIRIGIGMESEFRKLCKTMKERNTFLDFISIVGDESIDSGKGIISKNLEYAIAFASETIKEFSLEHEVKLIAIGNIENGFELLKLLSLGANSCMANTATKFSMDNSISHYYDESPLYIQNLSSSYKTIIKEATQLMRYAGFAKLEDIHPKKFFQQDYKFGIKSFEEIYFENTNYKAHDFLKKFMYN